MELVGIEPTCFPACKAGDHPLQSQAPKYCLFKQLKPYCKIRSSATYALFNFVQIYGLFDI